MSRRLIHTRCNNQNGRKCDVETLRQAVSSHFIVHVEAQVEQLGNARVLDGLHNFVFFADFVLSIRILQHKTHTGPQKCFT